ncbi:MAG TPA: alpha/beta hydrolase [Chloroflexota bacterium]|jgi:hypothetical protein
MEVRILPSLGIFAGAVAVTLALAWLLQRRMIYFPLPQDVPSAATALARAEDVTFDTGDGLRLSGWFAASGTGSGATVMVFNGNAGDRSFRAPLAEALIQASQSVMLFDYRGYGGNPGSPSERGLVSDARAAHRYVVSRNDVDPRRLVYFGESLGAAVAVALASDEPPAALILRSPFTSLADMGRVHYPFLPAGLFLRDRFPVLDQVSGVRCPVLVIAGDRDSIVPAEQSRRVYEAAGGSKRFVVIPGADHNDFDLLAGRQIIDEVVQFLRDFVPDAN